MRRHGNTFFEFLEVIRNHADAGFQAAIDNPIGTGLGSEFHVDDVNFIVCSHRMDLLDPLHFTDGDLRNQQCAAANFGAGGDTAELTWPENITRIGKYRSDADCAGLLIDLAVDKSDAAFVRKLFSIGEAESKWNAGRSAQQVAAFFTSTRS